MAATRQEQMRNIGIGVVALALGTALIFCARQWFGSNDTTDPTPQETADLNVLFMEPTFASIPPTQLALATATLSTGGMGCFDFLGKKFISPESKDDNWYQDGESTPYTNNPSKKQIVFCNNGKWDVKTISPDNSTYHVLVTSPFQYKGR